MSNTPLFDITIPVNGSYVNIHNASIQANNVQQCTTNSNEPPRTATQNNVNTPNFSQLLESHEAQKRVINGLLAKLHDMEAKYAETQNKYNYLLSALGNKELPEQARKAQIALKLDADYNEPDADGWYTPYLNGLAKYVGGSPSTLSRGVAILAECTNVIETRYKPDEPGNKTLQIRHIVPLATQSKIIPTAPVKRHGGDHRVTCTACGSEDLIEQKRHVCRNCGNVKEFPDIAVNKLSDEPLPIHPFISPDDTHLQDASQEQEQENTGDMLPLASCKLNYVRTHCSLLASCEDTHLQDASCEDTHLQDASGKLFAFDELKALSIWACHRAKRPYDAGTDVADIPASSTDESTWSSWEQVQAKYERSCSWASPYDGIGFMCNGTYTVIDLDHCIVDGVISDYAKAIMARFNSYTEVSQSGTGLHIIVRGTVPSGRKLPQIELYCEKRFMVWTGKHLASSHSTIEDYQAELDALYAELAPPAKETPQTSPIPHCVSGTLPLLSEEQVLLKARNGANGERFRMLYDDGNIANYPSQSEAELALCNELAYRSDNHVDTIDTLFRQSALYRAEKWDSPARAGETYGAGTIERALIRKQVAS